MPSGGVLAKAKFAPDAMLMQIYHAVPMPTSISVLPVFYFLSLPPVYPSQGAKSRSSGKYAGPVSTAPRRHPLARGGTRDGYQVDGWVVSLGPVQLDCSWQMVNLSMTICPYVMVEGNVHE